MAKGTSKMAKSKMAKGTSKMAKSKMETEMMGSESSDGDEKDLSAVMLNGMNNFGGTTANGMNKESLMSMDVENEQA
jgi:hypothetical protein